MKVLLVAERYWPEVGAAPSRLANMAEGLKKQGCEVDVLTSLPNYPKGKIFDGYRGCLSKYEMHGDVNLFRYWIFATVSRNPVFRILNMFSFAITIWLFAFKRKRIRSYDCVIIQTPTLVVAKSAMKLFKGLYGKKCVLNVSDIWPLTAVDMGAMKIGDRSWKYMARQEKYLFKLIADIDEYDTGDIHEFLQQGDCKELLEKLPKTEKLSDKQKKEVFRMVWMFTHGVASLVTSNRVELDSGEIEDMITKAYEGFVSVI